jgi:hypothetical protein
MLLAGLLFSSWAPTAGAQDTPTVSIHGFGGWALGQTSNDNSHLDVASEDLAVNNHYFTLDLLARPADKVSIHAQPTWQSNLEGQKLSIDLGYVEWEFARDTKLRAGKIKNPLGVYSEIFKVGTLRPFYPLPAGPYQNGPESYAGAGINRRQRLGTWELEVDVLGGQMDLGPSVIDRPAGQNPETHLPIFASVDVERQGRDFFGGGALVRPPIDGLEIGLTAYRMDVFAGPPGTRGRCRQRGLGRAVENEDRRPDRGCPFRLLVADAARFRGRGPEARSRCWPP